MKRAIRIQIGAGSARGIAALLPGNYRIVHEGVETVEIEGEDRMGWTLEDYVLPRLASGLYFGHEIPAEGRTFSDA